MKSLTTVLAFGLFAAVQLIGSMPGEAQTASPNFLGIDPTSVHLNPGGTLDVTGWMTSGVNDQGKAGNVVNVSAVLVYDSSVLMPTGFTAAQDTSGNDVWDLLKRTSYKDSSGNLLGFTVSNNPDKNGTYHYISFNGARQVSQDPTLIANETVYGTFHFKVLDNAQAGQTEIYYSNWNFKAKDLNNDSRLLSLLATTPTLSTSFGGPLIVTVSPAPPSLLVFALGALPALGVLRRRRAQVTSRA